MEQSNAFSTEMALFFRGRSQWIVLRYVVSSADMYRAIARRSIEMAFLIWLDLGKRGTQSNRSQWIYQIDNVDAS